jgi:hypothetical protein
LLKPIMQGKFVFGMEKKWNVGIMGSEKLERIQI